MSGEISFFVPGVPATYATKRERSWRAKISEHIPPPSMGGMEAGVIARFVLETMTPAGQPLDIDNLCEPLFSVLVNSLGWFRWSRSNIKWWSASKEEGVPHGCHVTISSAPAPPPWNRPPLLNSVYAGSMPRSARDPEPARWCEELLRTGVRVPGDRALACYLGFGSEDINLGDIATGITKSLIDCFYPIWGGVARFPADHRIDRLTVVRGVSGIAPGAVRVAVWDLPRLVHPGGSYRGLAPAHPPRKGEHAMQNRFEKAISNPCRPGTPKHLVCEAAIGGWPLERICRELDALKPGSSRRLSQYISDLRSENGLDIGHDGRNMWCRGWISRR